MNQRKPPIPDLALGAAGLLALVATFLPWWSFSETLTVGGQPVGDSITVNAWNAASHGGTLGKTITGPLVWIPMLLLLLLGALAAIRAYAAPQLLPGKRFYQLAIGIGALAAVLVIVRLVTYFKPPAVNTGDITTTASSGATFGSYLGLLLGLAVAGLGVWALRQPPTGTSGAVADGFQGYQQSQVGAYPQLYGQPQQQPHAQPQHGQVPVQPTPDLQQTQQVSWPQQQPPHYGQTPQAYGQPPAQRYPQQQPQTPVPPQSGPSQPPARQ